MAEYFSILISIMSSSKNTKVIRKDLIKSLLPNAASSRDTHHRGSLNHCFVVYNFLRFKINVRIKQLQVLIINESFTTVV